MSEQDKLKGIMNQSALCSAAIARMVHVHRSQVCRWIKGDTRTPKWAIELLEYKLKDGELK